MSHWFRVVACSIAALVVARSPLHGQLPPEQDLLPFETGHVVRATVQSPGGPRVLEGALRRAGQDSLVVLSCRWRATCERVAVPAARVGNLAVYRGRPGSAGGALTGGVVGLLGGAAVGGALGYRGCHPDDPCMAPVIYGIGGALAGFLLGLATGASMTSERWDLVIDYPPPP